VVRHILVLMPADLIFPGAPLVLLLAAGSICAQSSDPRPAYEAASVKLNNSGSTSTSSNGSKGQIVFTNSPLHRLVERAYDVKPYQVIGPEWMDNIRFDISAKYPPDTKPADRATMLRTLLEDRFKLAAHRETREMAGYVLVVAKGGCKLKPVEPGGSSTNTNGGLITTLSAKKASMEQLAAIVSRELGEVVIDRTGLDGVYDFELRWTKDDSKSATTDSGPSEPLPTLPVALQDALGLRLQAQKVPVEVIVVDHLERMPIEN